MHKSKRHSVPNGVSTRGNRADTELPLPKSLRVVDSGLTLRIVLDQGTPSMG
jgi:hypothetical protein